MRYIFRCRPIQFIFKWKWYSTWRLHHPMFLDDEEIRVLDIGMFVVGYAKKNV